MISLCMFFSGWLFFSFAKTSNAILHTNGMENVSVGSGQKHSER